MLKHLRKNYKKTEAIKIAVAPSQKEELSVVEQFKATHSNLMEKLKLKYPSSK